MHRLLPLFVALFLSANSSGLALDLSLSQIGPRVAGHHPALKAARLSIDEARARQVGAGRLPNPSVGLEFQNESRVSPRSTMLSLDQAFPVTKRLGLEKRLTGHLVDMAELEVQDAERRLIADAKSLAVKLLALDKQRALRRQQMALAEQLSDFARDRAAAGELSPLDAAQARLDAQRLLLEARRLETESVSLRGELKPMLGLRPADSLTIAGDLPSMAVPAAPFNLLRRTDYQLAQAKTEAARTGIELAVARRWQDVSAGLFAAHESQGVAGVARERTGFVGFRVSIPLPFWNANEGEIAEKAVSAERARLEAEALAATIASEADTARQEMQANAAFVRGTRDTLLPLVIEQTSQLEKAYESGQTDLLTLLRARDQRLQLEAAALDALRDFHLAGIRYEAATASAK